MASPEATMLIETVVGEFVAAGKSFTALDISRAVQERLTRDGLPFERHLALKDAVHDEVGKAVGVAGSGWDRTLVQIPGVSPDPNLYHLAGVDPQDYVNAVLAARGSLQLGHASGRGGPMAAGVPGSWQPNTAAPGGRGPAVATQHPVQRAVVDPGNRPTGRGGRLIIARCFLRKLAVSPGDKVIVAVSPAKDSILLTSDPAKLDPSSLVVRTMHADSQGRVRLNKTTRHQAGVDAPRFVIRVVNDHAVEVRPA